MSNVNTDVLGTLVTWSRHTAGHPVYNTTGSIFAKLTQCQGTWYLSVPMKDCNKLRLQWLQMDGSSVQCLAVGFSGGLCILSDYVRPSVCMWSPGETETRPAYINNMCRMYKVSCCDIRNATMNTPITGSRRYEL